MKVSKNTKQIYTNLKNEINLRITWTKRTWMELEINLQSSLDPKAIIKIYKSRVCARNKDEECNISVS